MRGNLRQGTTQLPMLPVQYTTEGVKGKPLPDRVVYVTGGNLVPYIPADPAIPPTVTATGKPPYIVRNGRLANGLSPKADCMARLMARGVSGVDALRAAYGVSGTPPRLATRASQVVMRPGMREAIANYRASAEREREQEAFGMRDFVLSRLTLEAQTAKQDTARIQALKLLGQSEAMWTSVQRTEKTIDQKDLQALKAQLEQRLRHAVQRLMPHQTMGLSQGLGTGNGLETGQTGPHPGISPLIEHEGPTTSGDTNPLTPPPIFHGSPREMEAGDFLLGSPVADDAGGSFHREMSMEDL